MPKFFWILGYPWLFGTAVPKRLELIKPNLACRFTTSMRNFMPNFSSLGQFLVWFFPKKIEKMGKKTQKTGFLAIYALWVMWASKFFAWMILSLGCSIMQKEKSLWLQVFAKITFEFFQKFEFLRFRYLASFFGQDITGKIPNLTHMIQDTYSCFNQNFIHLVQL